MLPWTAWAAPAGWPAAVDYGLGLTGVIALGAAIAVAVNARRRDRDLTRRTQRLAADKAGLHALLGTAPVSCCGWTVDGKELRSGRFAEMVAAVPGEEVAFDSLAGVLTETTYLKLREAVHALRNGGGGFTMDLLAAKGGRILAAEGAAMRDPGGQVVGHVVWFRDITEERNALGRARKHAAEMAGHKEQLEELTGNLPTPAWRRDVNFDIVWCNPAYAALFETTPQEAIRPPARELASAHDPQQGRRLAGAAREAAAPKSELRYFVVAGERRAFEVTEKPLASGEGLVGQARDVTDREQATAELVRHLDANRDVLQNVSTAIAIFGPDKRLQVFNRAYAKLWHLDEAWLESGPHFVEVLEAQREKRRLPEQADFKAFREEQVKLFGTVIHAASEDNMHLPDGTALKVSIAPHPFGGLVFMYEDVTNQLDLERTRRTLIAVQRASLDNLYEGVAVYGSDGRLKLHNIAFGKIWSLAADKLANEPHITDVIQAIRPLYGDGEKWPRLRDRMMALWIERLAQSGRIERPDGTVIDYASVPLPDGAVLFTYLDVTDSIRIERALRERNEALQTTDRLKSEFIANVSYELRTPLNTIIGFAEILSNEYFGKLTERQMEYSRGILESSNQLLLLINDILDLATIEAGHMMLEPESFDVHELLSSVLSLGRERARQEDLNLRLDCARDIGKVEADERRIKQVMFNLLSNAIKFTPVGGDIAVGAARRNDEVALWVEDTGVGIDAGEQDQVFEKFRKGSGPDRHRGAGLGLSLVKSFIELHGGRVDLRSTPDKGTKVTCYLPAAPGAESADTAAAD